MSDTDAQKRAAAGAAAALVESGMVVGLGTGSTAAWFVRALAERKLADLTCVCTSIATAELAGSLGLRLAEFGETREIDLTVDGADEIGPGLGLIKGAGGALVREKLVWCVSRRCVVIAEAGKPRQRLGAAPLPVEVTAFGHRLTAVRLARAIAEVGIETAPVLRMRDGAPVRTDGGNLIYDAPCAAIDDPDALAAAIKAVTGVVDHGLFLGFAERALIGTDDGVITLWP
jgi:ribose 5-phosphate isomerase A